MTNLTDAIQNRRTYYYLSEETHISHDKIIELVEIALKHTPTAFNMQSGRLVILFGKHNKKLWDHTLTVLKDIVPTEQLPDTEDKINRFKTTHGTVLFFEDIETIHTYQNKYPLYRDQFETWAQQSNGMLQSNIWMLLEDSGLGASLQHYNPLIDEGVHQFWNISKNWQLVAQMPFGIPVMPADKKSFLPIKNRIKIFEDKE